MSKIKKAASIVPGICSCGCGYVYVYLCDDKGRKFACFSLSEDQWIPFAQDAVRICHGQEPYGPNHTMSLQ